MTTEGEKGGMAPPCCGYRALPPLPLQCSLAAPPNPLACATLVIFGDTRPVHCRCGGRIGGGAGSGVDVKVAIEEAFEGVRGGGGGRRGSTMVHGPLANQQTNCDDYITIRRSAENVRPFQNRLGTNDPERMAQDFKNKHLP